MAKPKSRARQSVKDLTVAKLDEVLTAVQNLFILQALNANMNGKDIRALLKVDQWRVSKISKPLKQAKRDAAR